MKIQIEAVIACNMHVNEEIEVPDNLSEEDKQDYVRGVIIELADRLFNSEPLYPEIVEAKCSPKQDWDLTD
jgi:hypothetical protein